MKLIVAMLVVVFAIHTSPVMAALITFHYQGEEWDGLEVYDELDEWQESLLLAYANSEQKFAVGSMTLDAAMLAGGSVVNQSFSFEGAYEITDPVLVDFDFDDGVLSFGLDFLVAFYLDFSTDAWGVITVWNMALLTGPSPSDLALSSARGDGVGGNAGFDIGSSRPGTWTTHQVPVSDSLALLGLGLAGVVFLRRRRNGVRVP